MSSTQYMPADRLGRARLSAPPGRDPIGAVTHSMWSAIAVAAA